MNYPREMLAASGPIIWIISIRSRRISSPIVSTPSYLGTKFGIGRSPWRRWG
jgi:hypothetical protein